MTTRALAALALAALLPFSAPAEAPKLPDAKAFDKLVIDSLRSVHNTGADLYNEGKDFAGAYRVYQGALMTVRPLLDHRPAAQKLIDTGLDAAEKEADLARRAFLLHETIEAVRKHLKAASAEPKKAPEPPAKKPEETPTKKPDEPKKVTEPPAKKPDEPKKVAEPPAKKPEEPKKVTEPPAKKPEAPAPRVTKPSVQG